jgi:hypothetical protein
MTLKFRRFWCNGKQITTQGDITVSTAIEKLCLLSSLGSGIVAS